MPWLKGPLAILLANGPDMNVHILEHVLQPVDIVGFIAQNNGTWWQVKIKPRHLTNITERARCEKELDRLTLGRDHQMQFQPVEIPLFTGLIAAKVLFLVKTTATDTVVVTNRDGKGIKNVNLIGIPFFPEQT